MPNTKEKETERVWEQYTGSVRHFKLPDGTGWFYQNLEQQNLEQLDGSPNLKSIIVLITAVFDCSNEDIGDGRQLPDGSFLMVIDGSHPFSMSHPDDVKEILEQAGVKTPRELIKKKVNLFWRGDSPTPRINSPVLGISLVPSESPMIDSR